MLYTNKLATIELIAEEILTHVRDPEATDEQKVGRIAEAASALMSTVEAKDD